MPRKTGQDWQQSLTPLLLRLGLTVLAVFALLLLSAFPLHVGSLSDVRPVFVLMAVYYWAIIRPGTLTLLTAFLAGLFLDFLAGYPAGLNALIMVLAQWLTQSQRKFLIGQPFRVIWAGFALVALAAAVVLWTLFCLLYLRFVTPWPALASAVLTAVLFPLFVPPLTAVARLLSDRLQG